MQTGTDFHWSMLYHPGHTGEWLCFLRVGFIVEYFIAAVWSRHAMCSGVEEVRWVTRLFVTQCALVQRKKVA